MDCPLVMIEWEDSAQPVAAWQFLSELEAGSVVQCVSVGWLVIDDDQVKGVAPNMGDIGKESMQVSGMIRIPARCVTKITRLEEPPISCSPSSRPAKGRKRRAS